MNIKVILPLLCSVLLYSCKDNDEDPENNILMLKVDFITNTFEEGKEFTFSRSSADFTIDNEYIPPGDFGNIKLIYKEINEVLFDGSIVWMGTGQISFPDDMTPAQQFGRVSTSDSILPGSGFQNIFDKHEPVNEVDYETVWASVQSLVKVREYMNSNPGQNVKLFLYTPSVGAGNPNDWDWIVFLKK